MIKIKAKRFIAAVLLMVMCVVLDFNSIKAAATENEIQAEDYIYVPGADGNIKKGDDSVTYAFPSSESQYTSDHVYIKLTLATTADNSFFINPNGYVLSTSWNGDYGVCTNEWNKKTAFPATKYPYETVKGWGNIPCWKNEADTVTVTYDLNRMTKKLTVFTDNGVKAERDMVNNASSEITLEFVQGTTAVTSVEFGEVLPRGLYLTDKSGKRIDAVERAIGKEAYVIAYDTTDVENVAVLYAFYDDENRCLRAEMSKVKSYNGKYWISLSDGFKATVPSKTKSAKLFVFSAENLKPLKKHTYLGEYPENCTLQTDVRISFDSRNTKGEVMLVNERPCMEISSLAEVIGGTANEKTLTYNGVSVTYTEDSRLAKSGNGHIMLETAPILFGEKLYVPISSVETCFAITEFYNRFDKVLEITTGTDYPETEVTYYAKDFGAKGDGVTDDGPAITHAINAAINSGRPARVELEANKTYILGERIDNQEYFLLEDVSNLIFDGNGSELIFEKCTNSFLRLENCTNVKVINLEVDYKELPYTQGRVSNIDAKSGTFEYEVDEGYPLPASDEWVHKYWTDSRTGGWWFGQFMDSVEDRLKFTKYDNYFVDSVKPIGAAEERRYLITLNSNYASRLSYIEGGDRFVLNTRFSAYDIGDKTSDGFNHMIMIRRSGDITFENFTIYGSPHLGVSAGLCWGRISFKRFGEKTKPGRLLCVNSDGIHYWRNRVGVLVENSTFMNNLDDHINTKTEDGILLKKLDAYTYEVDSDLNYRVGDELMFYDAVNHKLLNTVYLQEFEQLNADKTRIKVDRPVEGTVENGNSDNIRATIIYNADSSGKGSVIRNNKFINSRRHAYIVRSANSVFEDNTVTNCGGAAVCAANEIGSQASEGPFPSAFTMRNNNISADGSVTYGYYPIQVKSWGADKNSSRAIDGFLIEGNTVTSASMLEDNVKSVYIDCVKDLYMLSNTIKYDGEISSSAMPIYVKNSEIAEINGLDFDYDKKVNVVITFDGCTVNKSYVRNIRKNTANAASKDFVIK